MKLPSIPKNSVIYPLLQWGLFPLFLVLPIAFAHQLMLGGTHFMLVTYGTVVVLWITFFVFEQLMPYRPQWNQPAGDIANDVLSATIAYGIIPRLLGPVYTAALAGVTAWLAVKAGGQLWPHDWPIWAQLVLLLLAGDAGRYWGHRLAHEIPMLWRFHAVHHSATRLWFFNGMRQHPVDKVWFMASELLFPILLGASGEVLSLYLITTAVCGYFQHTNMDVKLGPFYYLFNVVELHRWHHSKDIAESDNNYGNNLIIYDRLFGTCYHPEAQGESRQVGDIGLINPNYPKSYMQQFLAPFRKGRLDKESSQ